MGIIMGIIIKIIVMGGIIVFFLVSRPVAQLPHIEQWFFLEFFLALFEKLSSRDVNGVFILYDTLDFELILIL